MIISNYQLEPTIEENLNATESFLKSTCEEYSFDYDSLDKEITIEGITDAFRNIKDIVVAIFKRAIKIIVWIWKKLVSLVRTMITNFVKFVKKILGIKEKKPPVKIKYGIIIFENANVKEINTNSREEVINNFKQSIASISNEIRNVSQKNISFMKSFESKTNSEIAREQLKENYNILIEKVVYNNTPLNKGNGVSLDKDNAQKFIDNHTDDYFASAQVRSFVSSNDGVLQARTKADHDSESNINILNEEKLKLLKESQDIVKEYELYKSCQFDAIFNSNFANEEIKNSNKQKLPQLNNFLKIKTIYDILLNHGIPKNEITNFLKEQYFPSFENSTNKEADIRKWVNLKINYIEGIKGTLRKMLQTNYELFNISIKEMNKLSKDINENNFENFQKMFNKNIDKFTKFGGQVFDFRKIGLGCVCSSVNFAKDSDDIYNGLKDIKVQTLYNWITRYDVVLLAHGTDRDGELAKADKFIKKSNHGIQFNKESMDKLKLNIQKNESLHNEYKNQIDAYNQNPNKSDKEKIEYIIEKDKFIQHQIEFDKSHIKHFADELKNYNKNVVKWNGYKDKVNSKFKENCWIVEKTITPSGSGGYSKVEDWIRQVIKEGFKRIYIVSCNPGHHDLPDDLKNNKHVLIRIGTSSQLI